MLQQGTVLHDGDAGGVADGGQAVRDDDGGALPRRRIQRHLYTSWGTCLTLLGGQNHLKLLHTAAID